jgi:hypothetical protein
VAALPLSSVVRRAGLEPARIAPLAPQSETASATASEPAESPRDSNAPPALATPHGTRPTDVANEVSDLERAIVEATLAGRHDVASLLADRLRARLATEQANVVPLHGRPGRK